MIRVRDDRTITVDAAAKEVDEAFVGYCKRTEGEAFRRRKTNTYEPVVAQQDLVVSIAYFGAARGKWTERSYAAAELQNTAWGETTGDLYINDDIYFANIPNAVWRYELGGYPVLKKWLGYRQGNRRDGRPLTLDERQHFRFMIQRLAALLALHDTASALYEKAAAAAFSAEELGVRT